MSVPSPGSALAAGRRPSRIAFLALATLALTLVYTAWLGDDCYFTLRTVQNFLAGEGLRWNRFERVQAYTHPLWMFLLSGAIGLTGEHYLTTIAVGLACTLAASAVLLSTIGTREGRWVAALLLLSRAFIDYGTSGLENPLSYLLAALFLRELLREDPTPRGLARLALWGGLACVTRLDTVLLYLPALALRALALVRPAPGRLRAAGRAAGALALGFAPLVAWELFSCFYYGFPFPNTAYAKLGTGIPRDESLRQGLHYLADSLRRDPPTLVVIVLACGLALGRGRRRLLAPAAGVALYVAYVVSIGGDFMSGRFLALPFFVAAGLLGTGLPTPTPAMAQSAVLAAFALGLHLHQLPLVLRNYEPRPLGLSPEMNAHGIDDERFCVYDEMGLLRPDAPFRPEQDIRFRAGPEGVVFMLQGRQAFAAGPEAIAVETWGLADPLLARLPPRYTRFWRIGHFERILPRGYERTLGTGADHLEDRDLAEYHRRLRLVTAGPLFSLWRLRTALELNLGRHDHWIDLERYRFPLLRRGALEPDGPGRWRAAGGTGTLASEGVRLESAHLLRVRHITIELERGGLGAVQLWNGDELVRELVLPDDDTVLFHELELEGETATALWLHPRLRRRTHVTALTVLAE